MEKLEKDWKEYPILHFDLNISQYDSPDSLYKILNDILSRYEDEYGTRPSEVTLPLRFAGIIDRAYRKTGQKGRDPDRRVRQALATELARRGDAKPAPEHAQTLLRRIEDHG